MHHEIIYEAWQSSIGLVIVVLLFGVGMLVLGLVAPPQLLALLDGDLYGAFGVRPLVGRPLLSRKTDLAIERVMWLVGSVIVTGFGLVLGYAAVLRPAMLLSHGQASVVAGAVSQLHGDHFDVAGLRFENPDHVIDSAYAAAAQRGASVQAGLHVRVWYIGDRSAPRVLRIESVY